MAHDGVHFDIDQLSNSLKGEFNSLHPLTKDCCIYRVPPKIRMLKKSFYTPKIVSIGPLHHGRKELKAMEEHKLRYLQQFLERTQKSTNDFLMLIKDKEVELRNCYAETLPLKSEDFVKMILLDAVFLIGILLRYIPEFHSEDRIFTKPGMIKDIVLDIMLLENQLPIFILEDLFNLADLKTVSVRERYSLSELSVELPENASVPERYSLSQLTHFFFEYYICPDILINANLLESGFCVARHFVDLLRICLNPKNNQGQDAEALGLSNPSNNQGQSAEELEPLNPSNNQEQVVEALEPPNPPNTAWKAVVDWLRLRLQTPNPPNTTSMQAAVALVPPNTHNATSSQVAEGLAQPNPPDTTQMQAAEGLAQPIPSNNTLKQAIGDWLCLKTQNRPNTQRQADSEAAPSVTILHKAGIKFVVAPINCLLDIKFDNGTLRIPKLTIGGMTVHLLRNLQIYEALHSDTNYINDYDVVLKSLLSTPDDVEILIHNGVIENMILDSNGVSTLFQQLSRDARVNNDNFYYSTLVKDLKSYCKSRRHIWCANFMQTHCDSPSTVIAFVICLLVFVLTATQVACAFAKCQKK